MQATIRDRNPKNPLKLKSDLVFIDRNLEDYENLVASVAEGTSAIALDSQGDAIAQISRILQEKAIAYRGSSRIVHLVSHGSPGCLYLGDSELSLDTLTCYASHLKEWSKFASGLILYGCNVAAGDAGSEFIVRLHQLTGINIAASTQRTGNAALGGNWEFEVKTGDFEFALAFPETVRKTYSSVLAEYSVGSEEELREAIAEANNNYETDTILFTNDIFFSGTGSNGSPFALPTIASLDGLAISFLGNDRTISGSGFRVEGGDSGLISFSDLTITGGTAQGGDGKLGGGGGGGLGGGLFVNSGSVLLDGVIFADNNAIGGNGSFGANGGRGGKRKSGSGGGSGGIGGSSSLGAIGGSGGHGGHGGKYRRFRSSKDGGSGGSGTSGEFGAGGGGGGAGGGGGGGNTDGGWGGQGGQGGFGAGGGGGGAGGGGGDGFWGDGDGRSGGKGGLSEGFGGSGGDGGAGSGRNGGIGGQGGGGAGLGGAVFVNSGASLALIDTTFTGNSSTGGTGFENGQGVGGALFIRDGATVAGKGLNFDNNTASDSDNDVYGVLNDLISPIIAITSNPTVKEGGVATFNFTLSNVFPLDLLVKYALEGSATEGQDYHSPSGSVLIKAGSTSGVLNFNIVDDKYFDPDETLSLKLQGGENYEIDSSSNATVTIIDNEPLVSIAAGNAPIEGGSDGNFVVTLSNPAPAGGVLVSYTVGGTATPGKDYETLTPANLLIAEGQTSATIDISTFDDIDLDPGETVQITLIDPVDGLGYGVNGNGQTATLTIEDNENPPEVSIKAVKNTIAENGFGQWEVSLQNPAPSTGVVVYYQVDGSATQGDDYEGLTQSVFIRPGDTKAFINISSLDDRLAEGNETIQISLEDGNDYNLGSENTASIAIADNDQAGILFSSPTGATSENGGQTVMAIALTSQPIADVTVNLSSSDLGEGILSTSVLTFNSSNWNIAQTVTVTGVDDTETDGNQPYFIQATLTSNDSQYHNLSANSANITNLDNESANLLITQSNGSTEITEGGSGDSYAIALTAKPTDNVVVTLSPDGQIDLGEGAGKAVTLTFTPDNYNVTQNVQVNAIDDAIAEGNHTSLITHSISSQDAAYTQVNPSGVNVNITDNDRPTVTVAGGGNGSEQSGIPGLFKISLSDRAPTGGLEIRYSVDGSADAGTDYATLPGRIFIPEGEYGANVFVSPINDQIDESPESIHLTLKTDNNYQLGTANNASVTISDDDIAGVRIVEYGTQTNIVEAGATDSYEIYLTSQPTSPVTIQFNTDSSQISSLSSLTFTADNWQTAQIIDVSAIDDSIVEGSHSTTISHTVTSNDTNYQSINIGSVTVNIEDPLLNSQEFASSLDIALTNLQNGLDQQLLSSSLPIVGQASNVSLNFIDSFKDGLINKIKASGDTNGDELKQTLEEYLKPIFSKVNITDEKTADQTAYHISLGDSIEIFDASLATDLGLPGLGIEVDGRAKSTFDYDLDLGIGYHEDHGVFIDTSKTLLTADLDVGLDDNFKTTGNLGFLQFDLTNNPDNSTKVEANFKLDLNDIGGDSDGDGDRLTYSELKGDLEFGKLFDYSLSADANLGLSAVTSIEGDSAFPSLSVDINGQYPLFSYSNTEMPEKVSPQLSFDNLQLDSGTFITNFARPIIKKIDKVIDPFRPIIDFLNKDTKILSKIGLEKKFDTNKDGKVTVLELASKLAGKSVDMGFIETTMDIIDYVDKLNALPEDLESFKFDLGSYKLGGDFDATDATQTAKDATVEKKVASASVEQQISDLEDTGSEGQQKNFLEKWIGDDNLDIPIIDKPAGLIDIFLGKNTNILTYDVPEFDANFSIETTFPIWWFVKGKVEGSLDIKADLDFGFDTFGLNRWRNTDWNSDDWELVLDGFYVSDRANPDGTGEDVQELTINAEIAAGVGVDLGVLEGYVTGGLQGIVGIDLVDEGELNGTDDGKIRASEIDARFDDNIWDLFQIQGAVNAFLAAELEIDYLIGSKTVYDKKIATFPLAEFGLGPKGNYFGSVFDGAIASGTVFLDANFNGVLDANEPYNFTNFDGSFDINIPLAQFDLNGNSIIDSNEGQIVVIGGVDTSTFLDLETPLSAIGGASIITPLTTLTAALFSQGNTVQDSQNKVKTALGLAQNIDLNHFDPFQAIAENNPMGLSIFSQQVQVQNTIIQATKLIQGATNLTTGEIATTVIAAIANQVNQGTLDLSNTQHQATLLNEIVTRFGQNQLQSLTGNLAEIIAKGNEQIDAIAADTSLALSEAEEKIVEIQTLIQGETGATFQQIGSGETTLILLGDLVTTNEDIPLTISVQDLLANDLDLSNQNLKITGVSNAFNGTVELQGDEITFTPDRDYFSIDFDTFNTNPEFFSNKPELFQPATFEYEVTNANGETNTATVTLFVNPINDAPQTTNDIFTTDEDIPLDILRTDLLMNDSDPDGNLLNIDNVGNAIHGKIEQDNAGNFRFTPDENFFGEASFDYTVSDGQGEISTATVEINVNSVDDPLNPIEGTRGRDRLTGTPQEDIITGRQGADILTGGKGADLFVYNSPRDAGDIITDFELGQDKLVFSELLSRFSYQGSDPIADGYIRLGDRGQDTILQFDTDGLTGAANPRSFLTVKDVSSTALEDSSNFIF